MAANQNMEENRIAQQPPPRKEDRQRQPKMEQLPTRQLQQHPSSAPITRSQLRQTETAFVEQMEAFMVGGVTPPRQETGQVRQAYAHRCHHARGSDAAVPPAAA